MTPQRNVMPAAKRSIILCQLTASITAIGRSA
jgi:hypothetical protein